MQTYKDLENRPDTGTGHDLVKLTQFEEKNVRPREVL